MLSGNQTFIWINVWMPSRSKVQDGADLSDGLQQCNMVWVDTVTYTKIYI